MYYGKIRIPKPTLLKIQKSSLIASIYVISAKFKKNFVSHFANLSLNY